LAGGSLRIICGPTASGKSRIALELAALHNAAIISADSRQVYRGFDIGTAKPSRSEQRAVEHCGIDVAEPNERYSAARWASEACEWIDDVRRRGKTPLIVGGTGLYIRALVDPLFAAPLIDPAKRSALEDEFESMTLPELRQWCEKLDPARAHLGRTQLQRAIETALLTGERISDLHAQAKTVEQRPATQARYLVLDPGSALQSRIPERVEFMLAHGWAEEVAGLIKVVPADAPAWKASGYSTLRAFVNDEIDLSSARERVIIETRQYAKRQRTWFRHQLPAAAVTRVNPDDPDFGAVVHDWWETAE
jgi:tRNA dimethylallyltransferase